MFHVTFSFFLSKKKDQQLCATLTCIYRSLLLQGIVAVALNHSSVCLFESSAYACAPHVWFSVCGQPCGDALAFFLSLSLVVWACCLSHVVYLWIYNKPGISSMPICLFHCSILLTLVAQHMTATRLGDNLHQLQWARTSHYDAQRKASLKYHKRDLMK